MAETVLNQQESKIESSSPTPNRNIYLKRVIGIILSLVMVVLTVYVLNLQHENFNILSQSTDIALNASYHATNNYRTYVGRYKETKIELDETTRKLEEVNRQLNQVTAELSTTKGMLSQTQGELALAQAENAKLNQELQGIDNLKTTENAQNIDDLQAKIQTLKENNSQISLQLDNLKDQLRAFNADFSDLPQGRDLIKLFRAKIRLVKIRMHYLREQAFLARVEAQKEKDRLALLNGNSGYVVRNGQLQSPEGQKKSFAIDVKVMQ